MSTMKYVRTRRRGVMLSRATCWTIGVIVGFVINRMLGCTPDLRGYIEIWSGMMVATAFIYFDPPIVRETAIYRETNNSMTS